MTNDEEKQLRLELLAADIKLRRKQEFWETPRNIAILVGVTAAIAAAIGFWLGRESTPPAPNTVRPIASAWFGEVRGDEFIDAVQTATLIVIAAMLIYVGLRLNRAVTIAAEKVQGAFSDMMKTQNQIQQNVRRVWERIDLIESKQGNATQQNDRAVLGEWVGRAWQHIEKVEARLEALEKGEPPPPMGAQPTDPPFGPPPNATNSNSSK